MTSAEKKKSNLKNPGKNVQFFQPSQPIKRCPPATRKKKGVLFIFHRLFVNIYIHATPNAAQLKLGLFFCFSVPQHFPNWSCLTPRTEWPKDNYGLEASPNGWQPRPTVATFQVGRITFSPAPKRQGEQTVRP